MRTTFAFIAAHASEHTIPDTAWLADISYIPTDEGWIYLTAVKDLATMEIVGW